MLVPSRSLLLKLTACALLTTLPQSCHDSKCDKALKYGCEWLPKEYLKCDDGGKHKVYVK